MKKRRTWIGIYFNYEVEILSINSIQFNFDIPYYILSKKVIPIIKIKKRLAKDALCIL